ncbi:protein IQ-DOMAIN 33 isoform X2 [Silene latifolia]|uniref:protein IQ-DOMAIN 33 isoform X2 n=1 Tax=Silene latifolia TaxID=37657 RepID=UPI003D7748CC
MGITGELVRSVFSKSRSISTHDTYRNNNVWEKKRWKTTVRAYLCGDKMLFSSVLAEEDTASVKSSEATVTQPVLGEVRSTDENEKSHTINSDLLDEDVAATIIQSTFRGFLVRRLRMKETEDLKNEFFEGLESPNRESLATSIDVQTGNSISVISTAEECPSVCTKVQQKTKLPSLFIQKEDWDDSTVDSNVSKMRIQNRLEAMTRRERALAYAFSQQLRMCPKKKQTIFDSTESSMGWTWLERWMATRQPKGLSMEDRISQQLNELTSSMKTKQFVQKKFLDLSFEGKESCGSNEVLVNPKPDDKDAYKSSGNRLKAPRNISKRKTVPTGYYQKEHAMVKKREGLRAGEMDRRQKIKQSEISDDVCHSSADHPATFQT